MLKGTLLYLANQRPVYRLIMRHDLLRGLAQRYVAGEELADGIVIAQTLNTQRMLVSLDHLGESVTSAAAARRAVAAYLEALEAISQEQVEGNISLKLTQLGLDVSREECVVHLRTILERARALDIFVRIDMESSAYTQRTLDMHAQLWDEGFRNVGIVLQSALYRTAADVERALQMGVRVRLCKGAYLEPSSVAYADKAAVDANFARLQERLLLHGAMPAIATHDERLIRRAREVAAREGIAPDRFEFQMLFGVRRDLQFQLVRDGYRVRIYLPYGREWYPYLMRRLAERPANLGFFVRSAAAGSARATQKRSPRDGSGGLRVEQLALALALFDQSFGRSAATWALLAPVVFLGAADDDVCLVQKERPATSVTAQAAPVLQTDRLRLAWPTQHDGAARAARARCVCSRSMDPDTVPHR